MTAVGRWKILAPVDPKSRTAENSIRNVLDTADRLRADVTLLSVRRAPWFGARESAPWSLPDSVETKPSVSVQCVSLTGPPAETIAEYADRTAANAIVLPPEYCSRRFLARHSIAMQIAALTARPMLTLPERIQDGSGGALRRIACIGRGDASDQRILRVSEAFAERCGTDVVTVFESAAMVDPHDSLREVAESLIRRVEQQRVGLLVAARPVYAAVEARRRDLLGLAGQLPCPVLWVPLISAAP